MIYAKSNPDYLFGVDFNNCFCPAVYAEPNIPETLKDDITVPPNGAIAGSTEKPVYVEITSPQSLEEAAKYYKDQLSPKGWILGGEYPNPAEKTHQLLFQKDGKTLAIGIGLMKNGDSITRILLQ